MTGCKGGGAAQTPAHPEQLARTASATTRPAFRLGAADELGWRLYQRDRTIAGVGEAGYATYGSHE
jgi:hypothetical protein